MTITEDDFRSVCMKIGKMRIDKMINQLHSQGLSFHSNSVRQRRLYKAAYRMLKFGNYKTSATETSKQFLYNALLEISKNIISDSDSYIKDLGGVFINQVTTEIEQIPLKETIHKQVGTKQVAITEEKIVTRTNFQKLQHKQAVMKASTGKLSKTAKKVLARFEREDKHIVEFVQQHNWFPDLVKAIDEPNCETLLSMGLDRSDSIEGMREKMCPWSVDGIECLEKFKMNYDYRPWEEHIYNPWLDLKDFLLRKPTVESELIRLKVKKPTEFNPEIMDQPDVFEDIETVIIGTYDQPIFKHSTQVKNLSITHVTSTNHRGIKPNKDTLDMWAEEIYKISDLPGFSILKTHWNGLYKKNKQIESGILGQIRLINDKYSEIREDLEEFPEKNRYLDIRKSKNSKGKKNKKKKREIERSKAIQRWGRPLIKKELDLLRTFSKERDNCLKSAKMMDKEDYLDEIKTDLKHFVKSAEVVGDQLVFEKFTYIKDSRIPAFAQKRYQAIMRGLTTNTDIYTCLKYHFNRYGNIKESRRAARFHYIDGVKCYDEDY